MRQQAQNNSLNPEIFKQFIGGENLTPEQAGDMLQMLKESGSRDDFKRALNRTKAKAAADKVIDDSVLGPKMIKDWIKQTDISTQTHITAALTVAASVKKMASIAASTAKYWLLAGAIFLLIKKWGNIKQWAYETLGEPFYKMKGVLEKFWSMVREKLTGLPQYVRGATQSGRVMWNRILKPGQLFDKFRDWMSTAKDYLSQIPDKLHDIWQMFKSGAARVQATVVSSASSAVSRYGEFKGKAREKLGDFAGKYASIRDEQAKKVAELKESMNKRLSGATPEQAAAIRAETAAKIAAIRRESNARLTAIKQEAAAATSAAKQGAGSMYGAAADYAGDAIDPFSGSHQASPDTKSKYYQAIICLS
jgi:hypothetical protein